MHIYIVVSPTWKKVILASFPVPSIMCAILNSWIIHGILTMDDRNSFICASTRLEIHWAGSLSSSTKGYPSRSENHVVGMLKTDPFRSNSMAFLLDEKRKSEKYTWHAVQLSGCHLVNCRTRFSLPSWNQSHLGQHSTWHSWQQLQRHSECFWEHARPP